ncbi:MAG TPA: serine hydrolase domain-containing protein [Ohtaekwangia sp.]|nr:serine hydrolase domain-containing protein [Ohtaekwangia sp.]
MTNRFILLFGFLFASQLVYGQANNTRTKINKIDSLLQQLISDKKTVGFAFGIQIGDAEPITKEYGLAHLSTGKRVTPTDQFRIASITKTFTATAVMKLIELKKLNLTDSLTKFFPNYPNGENISIYQLLSHTSGIPNWWDGEMSGNVPNDFPMCKKPHQYLQGMKKNALFAPGEFYSYSNSNYVLLGEIIETVSGQSYESFLLEHIYKPARMNATELEYIEKTSDHWVRGYVRDTTQAVPFVDPDIYHMPFSAGGLRSTTHDLLKFIEALNTGKIVSEKSLKKMTSYALLNDGRPVYEGVYRAPNAAPRKPHQEFQKRGYGLGFNLMELYTLPVYYHSGGIAGFNSYLIRIPKNNTTIALLANTENGIVPVLKAILKLATEIK